MAPCLLSNSLTKVGVRVLNAAVGVRFCEGPGLHDT